MSIFYFENENGPLIKMITSSESFVNLMMFFPKLSCVLKGVKLEFN